MMTVDGGIDRQLAILTCRLTRVSVNMRLFRASVTFSTQGGERSEPLQVILLASEVARSAAEWAAAGVWGAAHSRVQGQSPGRGLEGEAPLKIFSKIEWFWGIFLLPEDEINEKCIFHFSPHFYVFWYFTTLLDMQCNISYQSAFKIFSYCVPKKYSEFGWFECCVILIALLRNDNN